MPAVQPGVLYSLTSGGLRSINDCEPYPLGRVIRVDGHRCAVCGPPEREGQPYVGLDRPAMGGYLTRVTVETSGIFAETAETLSAEELVEAVRVSKLASEAAAEAARQEREAAEAARRSGAAWFAENRPEWAKAVIVAEI